MKRIVGIVAVVVMGSAFACSSDVPGPTNPDPTNPDPTNPDPTNPDPTNPDPTNPEPFRPSTRQFPGVTALPAAPLALPVSLRNETPRIVKANDRYQLVTTIAIPPTALLPQPAYELVTLLSDFRDSPARTLIGLLEDAGVPVVGDLLDALPSALESRLYGWIDGYINSALFGGNTVGAELDSLLGAAGTALTHFDLMSELVVPAGAGTGEHHARALRFQVQGQSTVVALPAQGTVITSQTPTVAVVTPVADADGTLSIGDHQFGIPVGDYIYAGLDQAAMAKYGVNFRGALSQIISCQALAESVADRCVLGVCVGHESQLTEICEKGLDEVVSQIRSKLDAYDIDGIRFQAGTAKMFDVPAAGGSRDGVVDHLDGDWTCQLNASQGLRPVDASFVGTSLR